MHLSISVVINLTDTESTGFVDDFKPDVQSLDVEVYRPLSDFSVKRIYAGTAADIPRKCDVVVITDKPEYIQELPFDDPVKLYPVYIGDAGDVRNSFLSGQICEVWPANEDDDVRSIRFVRMLRGIKAFYDAWLYENILTTVTDSVPDMIWFKDREGIHWRVNRAFCTVVRKTKADCRGRSHSYIWGVPEIEGLACQESEEQVIRERQTCEFEEPVNTIDGVKQFKVYKTPIFNRFGDICGTTGVGHDITDFSNMGLELSLLVENIPLPLMICSAGWKIVRMNGVFRNSFFMSGTDTEIFNYKSWAKRHLQVTSVLEENNESKRSEGIVRIGGSDHVFIINEKRIFDYYGNTSGYFCIFRDITDERQHEKEIYRMANTDVLTGLYNRRYLFDYLKKNASETMTLLYMDLDYFKEVNDTYGHARGDEVLRKTAEFIREVYPDGVAARIGGDEYAVVLKRKMKSSEFEEKEELLQNKMLSLFRRDNPKDLYVTISVGMMVKDKANDDSNFVVSEFLVEADKKMYEAKCKHHKEQTE